MNLNVYLYTKFPQNVEFGQNLIKLKSVSHYFHWVNILIEKLFELNKFSPLLAGMAVLKASVKASVWKLTMNGAVQSKIIVKLDFDQQEG